MTHNNVVKGILGLCEDEPRAWVLKVVGGPAQRRGIPDILILWKGAFIAVEVKTGKATATKSQTVEMKRIRRARGFAGVVRSVEGFEEFVQFVEKRGQKP